MGKRNEIELVYQKKKHKPALSLSLLSLGKKAFFCIFLLFAFALPAFAAKGNVVGMEMQGFGRIVFTMDKEVQVQTRLINTIFVVEFDEAVQIDVEKLALQLPRYVSMVRADPDGRSLRFALMDKLRVDLKQAGERVYIDLLPSNWQGNPPPLPADVVQDLVKRARAAEDRLRRISREEERLNLRQIELKTSQTKHLKRAIFIMPRIVPASHVFADGALTLLFEANFQISRDALRAKLAGLVEEIDIDPGEDVLRITLKPYDGINVTGFREDESYIIDFSRVDGAPIETLPPAKEEKTPPSKDKKKKDSPAPPTNKSSIKEGGAAPVPAPTSPKSEAQKSELPTPSPSLNAASQPNMAPPEHAVEGRKRENHVVDVRTSHTNTDSPKPSLLDVKPGGTLSVAQLAQFSQAIELQFDKSSPDGSFDLRLSHIGANPIAIYRRANDLFVLIETKESPNLPKLEQKNLSVKMQRFSGGTLYQISSVEGMKHWLTREQEDLIIHGAKQSSSEPSIGQPIHFRRHYDQSGRDSLDAIVGTIGALYSIDDPIFGNKLGVVPAAGAGLFVDKNLNFNEFSIEKTLAGLVVVPKDEAVELRREIDSVRVGHEVKLNLSGFVEENNKTSPIRPQRPLLLNYEEFKDESLGNNFLEIEKKLTRITADAPLDMRSQARERLARFYAVSGFYPESKGVLEMLALEDQAAGNNRSVVFMRALAHTMMDRLVDAAKVLSEPVLADEGEQLLLRAVVEAKALRYPQAVALFRQTQSELGRYPPHLQAQYRALAIRAAVEAQDANFAREQLREFEKIDENFRDPNLQQLLAAKLAESQNRFTDAFHGYSQAAQSRDRMVEAEGRFGKADIGLHEKKIKKEEAIAEFETLSIIWRRGETEIKALEKLLDFYVEDGRWRDAFLASQRASLLMPDNAITRRMEASMAQYFENIFLDNQKSKLSRLESLALYQEFKHLIPPGRKGDEIARRLADHLAALDLVDEASDILEHQIENRLKGAARTQAATRLAALYLQTHKPEKVIEAINKSRLNLIPEELRRARILLEARALGELFRPDIAIELLAEETGGDVDRLRADILWKGKKWREAGEAYERVLGDTWRKQEAISPDQRLDILRTALSYVLSDEQLSLDRMRERYASKLKGTDDEALFKVISLDQVNNPQGFRDAVRKVVSADTLSSFMSSYRKRYPETGGLAGAKMQKQENEVANP